MNYRRFAKAFVGVVIILCCAGIFLMVNELWLRIFFIVVAIASAILLFRETKKDVAYMERYRAKELSGQVLVQAMKEVHDENKGKPKPRKDTKQLEKELLAANLVVDAAATPVVVVDKLRKMQ